MATDNKKKTTGKFLSETQNNATINSDKPVTGGESKIVINELQIRQAIRTAIGITDWRSSLIASDARYYPNRTRLYDIYTDVLLDGHLSGIIEKRIATVLNKPIFYKDKDGRVIETMNPFIASWEFRKVMAFILETQLWGITGIEFIPGATMQARSIPRKHIKPKKQIISFEQNDQENGMDYTKLDNVWIIGDPDDLGLLLKCAPYVIYKRGTLGDWAQYIEVFGMPIRTMYYDANDQQAKIELKQILDESGSALAIMIPKGVEFKLEDGKTSNGNGDLQLQFINTLNGEMSILILGNTETTTGGGKSGGSLAKSKVHQEQQNEIAKSDIIYLSAKLNDPHFIKILQSYGFPLVAGGSFEVNKDIDITFLAQRSEVDTTIKGSGVPISDDYFYQTYNIPKPDNYDEMKAEEETEETPPPPKKAAKKKPAIQSPDLSDLADIVIQKMKDANFFD